METEGPDCDWCGASGAAGDLDVYSAGDIFVCGDCREKCDRTFVPAADGSGVEAWEVSPCLCHRDPHDCSSYTEAYETLDEAEECAYEGTGTIFWGVYAVMRESHHSDVITPTMHLRDFDSPKDAHEFVRALGGKETRA